MWYCNLDLCLRSVWNISPCHNESFTECIPCVCWQYCVLLHYISCSKCLWLLAFAARQNYWCVNANTLIVATILFSGHMGYATASPWLSNEKWLGMEVDMTSQLSIDSYTLLAAFCCASMFQLVVVTSGFVLHQLLVPTFLEGLLLKGSVNIVRVNCVRECFEVFCTIFQAHEVRFAYKS